MKLKNIILLLLSFNCATVFAQTHSISSPDGKLELDVNLDNSIKWQVTMKDTVVVSSGPLSFVINGKDLGKSLRLTSVKKDEVKQTLHPVVARKSKEIVDHYNELNLKFNGNFSLILRLYNDGFAYRFATNFRKDIKVNSEDLTINFPEGNHIYFPSEASLMGHYEPSYHYHSLPTVSKDSLGSLPTLLQSKAGVNVLITEADIFDYPNMFINGTGGNSLKAVFPKAVLETVMAEEDPDRTEEITKLGDYLTITDGKRNFPWRVFVITENDGDLVENQLVFKLSKPLALEETDWIKPGKVAWDWYNANNVYNVDFRAGINTQTYKHYIDFASENGLEYIILDEGWSKSTTDISGPNEDIDLEELVSYGNEKNVDIILWMLWKPLDENLEPLLDKFEAWGVKGIKIDFMQRADKDMVNYYERVAKEAAERKLLVNFHSSYKPTGLSRAYPNVITYEGVKGLENNKWGTHITPQHNLTLPFIRMVAGAMDYTPGAMTNANQDSFAYIFDTPMSQGTRSHQAAMYVLYESPLQMLADSPTQYNNEPESRDFISRIPTTWDESHVLHAKVGNYLVMARKNGAKWYIGAMTDWTSRDFDLDLSFLGEGTYTMDIMADGINADRNANDFKRSSKEVSNDSALEIKLAPGGGWVAIIEKKE